MPAARAYSRSQIVLHWTIAALVIFQIFAKDSIVGVWQDRMSGAVANQPTPNLHVATGVLILVLMLWRLGLRLRRGAPALPTDEPPILKALGRLVHGLFYLLLVAMPLSGAIAWFAGLPQPALGHSIASKVLIALVLLHIVAALAQHFWFRSDVLNRMVGRA